MAKHTICDFYSGTLTTHIFAEKTYFLRLSEIASFEFVSYILLLHNLYAGGWEDKSC